MRCNQYYAFAVGMLTMCYTHLANAQTNLALAGKVFDATSREPLAFASISIAGKSLGTVTNAVGEFDFNLPEQYSRDTLVISPPK